LDKESLINENKEISEKNIKLTEKLRDLKKRIKISKIKLDEVINHDL